MAQQHIELIKRNIAALNEGDLDAALAELSEDFVMDWSNSIGPVRGVYQGREGLREVWASFLDAFDEFVWEPQEFIEVDESRLILVNRVRVRGRGSGVEVNGTGAQLWTFQEGEAKSFKLYQTRDEALEAVGISK